MDPSQDSKAPARPARETNRTLQWLRPAGERLMLWLHRQAERLDLVPTEFGAETSVDREDAGSLATEWLRQARLWAGYNPEQMLALKAGAVALGAALLFLVVLVGAIR
ncbi:MAG: hypothetical protein JWP73_2983 [Phenylobacterium sp.]|nr:hypothetical protein [Phenylobacterium sp.]